MGVVGLGVGVGSAHGRAARLSMVVEQWQNARVTTSAARFSCLPAEVPESASLSPFTIAMAPTLPSAAAGPPPHTHTPHPTPHTHTHAAFLPGARHTQPSPNPTHPPPPSLDHQVHPMLALLVIVLRAGRRGWGGRRGTLAGCLHRWLDTSCRAEPRHTAMLPPTVGRLLCSLRSAPPARLGPTPPCPAPCCSPPGTATQTRPTLGDPLPGEQTSWQRSRH